MAGKTGKKRKKTSAKAAPAEKVKVSKIPLWLKHFLNQDNPDTFFNKGAAAKAAGYKTENYDSLAQIGCHNYKKCLPKIKKWLDEEGLSEVKLKSQLSKLITAKETRLQSIKGDIVEIDPSVKILVKGAQGKYTQQGDHFIEIENIVCVELDDNRTQIKAIDLGLKAQDLYPSEKYEHKFENVQLIMELPPDEGDGPETQKIGDEDAG
jgi:hypothetical protein